MTSHKCNKEREIGMILQEIKDLRSDWDEFKRDVKSDVKKNTEFRIKANGVIGLVSFVSMTFGSIIMWFLNKFMSR